MTEPPQRIKCYFTDGRCDGCECECHKKPNEDKEFEKFRHDVFWETAMGTCIGSGDDMAYVDGLFNWLMSHNNTNVLIRHAYEMAQKKFGHDVSIEAYNAVKADASKHVKDFLDLHEKIQEERRKVWKLTDELAKERAKHGGTQ